MIHTPGPRRRIRCPPTCSMVGSPGFACAVNGKPTPQALYRSFEASRGPIAVHAYSKWVRAADPTLQVTAHSCSVSVTYGTLSEPCPCLTFIRHTRDDGTADGARWSIRLVESWTKIFCARQQVSIRRMLCAQEAASVTSVQSVHSVGCDRWPGHRARWRPVVCASSGYVRATAAQQPPALLRALTAVAAATMLSSSVAGACHANELFQKSCAGVRHSLHLCSMRSAASRQALASSS